MNTSGHGLFISIEGGEGAGKSTVIATLSDLLSADGVRVARRTVAKYREGMGILTSSKRKQMF